MCPRPKTLQLTSVLHNLAILQNNLALNLGLDLGRIHLFNFFAFAKIAQFMQICPVIEIFAA